MQDYPNFKNTKKGLLFESEKDIKTVNGNDFNKIYDTVEQLRGENTDKSQITPLVLGIAPMILSKKLSVENYVPACETEIFKRKFNLEELSCNEDQARNWDLKNRRFYCIKKLLRDVTDR